MIKRLTTSKGVYPMKKRSKKRPPMKRRSRDWLEAAAFTATVILAVIELARFILGR
jgi:hypothetical protein